MSSELNLDPHPQCGNAEFLQVLGESSCGGNRAIAGKQHPQAGIIAAFPEVPLSDSKTYSSSFNHFLMLAKHKS